MSGFTDIYDNRSLMKRARKNYSVLGWSILLFFFICSLMANILSIFFVSQFPEIYSQSWFAQIFNFACFYIFAFPFFLGIVYYLPSQKPKEHKIKVGKWFIYLLIAITFMQIGGIISNILMTGVSLFREDVPTNIVEESIKNEDLISIFIGVCVVAPIMEELTFRKLFIDKTNCFSEKLAMFTSAFAFALFHRNFFQFFYAFLLGLLFAYIYIRTGRIRYTMLLHAAVNFIGGVIPSILMKFSDPTVLNGLEEPANAMAAFAESIPFIIWSLIIGAASLCGFVLLILFWKKRFFLSSKYQLPKGSVSSVILNGGIISMTIVFTAICILQLFL